MTVPGVVAFFADAPRRPEWSCRLDSGLGDSGFQVDSFQGIDGRPFLFNSSIGDIGPDRCASAARITAWQESTRPNKLLSWSSRLEVNHGTVDLSDDGCAGPINTQLCRWLESLGVAYLDAAVRSRPAAQDWLDSDVMRVMTLNRIELHRR